MIRSWDGFLLLIMVLFVFGVEFLYKFWYKWNILEKFILRILNMVFFLFMLGCGNVDENLVSLGL